MIKIINFYVPKLEMMSSHVTNIKVGDLTYHISMPPIRRQKRRPIAFVVPYHRFLGPGIDVERLKNCPPLNKLDWAAKRHDINYGNPKITTEKADEQFYKDSENTGLLGIASRTAFKLKHALNETFRNVTHLDSTPESFNVGGTMVDQSDSTIEDTTPSNGWEGTNIGSSLPPKSGNEMRTYKVYPFSKNY